MNHQQICKKIKISAGWKSAMNSLNSKEGKLLTWEMFYSRMFPTEFINFKKGIIMAKKFAILLILMFGCKNPTEPQNKNFFTTGVIVINKDETVTISRIEGIYLQIKYAGYNNQYAIINYTGLQPGRLDNMAAFVYDSVQYPISLSLLMNIFSVKIDVLLITGDRFYFIVREYPIR